MEKKEKKKVRKERITGKILDNWSVLIKNAQGQGEKIWEETERIIQESEAPNVRTEKIKLLSGGIFFGKERDYPLVENEDLTRYRMYIGVRDYGNNLDVQWYLTTEVKGLRFRKLSKALKAGLTEARRTLFGWTLFELQDLTAYVTVIHHSLLEAVERLMSGLGQDPSKIDRKSKGFLGVS